MECCGEGAAIAACSRCLALGGVTERAGLAF